MYKIIDEITIYDVLPDEFLTNKILWYLSQRMAG